MIIVEQANETQTAVATNENTVTEVQAVTEPVQTNNVFSAGATPNIEPQPVEVPLAEMQIQNVNEVAADTAAVVDTPTPQVEQQVALGVNAEEIFEGGNNITDEITRLVTEVVQQELMPGQAISTEAIPPAAVPQVDINPIVENPVPNNGNGHRAGNHRQIENAAESGGGGHGHLADGGGHPQRESTGNGYGNHHDDQCVLQRNPEHLILEQILVIIQADKNILPTHGGIEKAGDDAHDHGIDHEAQEEDQERQQEQIRSDRFMDHQAPGSGVYRNFFVCQGYPPL